MTAKDIVDRLGGVSAVAREMGVPLTTVSSWARFNSIPLWRQPKLLELATARNESLATTDFPSPDERVAA
jgi:hypothetical protein